MMQKSLHPDPACQLHQGVCNSVCFLKGWPEVQLLFSGWIKRALIRESYFYIGEPFSETVPEL